MVASDKSCPICRKTFTSDANLKFHTNRQTPCVAFDSVEPIPLIKNFKCNRCEVCFQSNYKLTSHLNRKTPCAIKDPQPEEIELRLLFDQLQHENQQQKQRIDQLEMKAMSTVTNNNNNIQNNINSNNTININVYGKEDMSHISDAMYRNCFRRVTKSVEHLFDMKHFSKNMPNNHNLYISNLRDVYMMIYEAGQWNKVNREDAMDNIYDDLKENLEDAMNMMRDKNTLDISLDNLFAPFVEDGMDEEKEQRIKKMSCDLMACMAYNNRHFPTKIKGDMDREIKRKLQG
jgi:hypothetical protein